MAAHNKVIMNSVTRLCIISLCLGSTLAFAPAALKSPATRGSSSAHSFQNSNPFHFHPSCPYCASSSLQRPTPSPVKHATLLSTALQSSTSSRFAASSNSLIDKKTVKAYVSAVAFVVLDIFVRRFFLRANISFPSSLAGCGFLFATLLALPNKVSEKVFDALNPGARLLAQWLPVFFVPSLVTLPLAQSMGAASELAKVGVVVVGGFFFTLLTTAWSVVSVRNAVAAGVNIDDSASKAAADVVVDKAEPVVRTIQQQAKDAVTFAEKQVPTKGFSTPLLNGLLALACTSGGGALASVFTGASMAVQPFTTLFLLATTLASFVYGARLPKRITKVVHPLVTCTGITWAVAGSFAAVTGRSFRSMLKSYRTGTFCPTSTGAGDLLLFLLGPAVVSLAISMYDRRKLMRENLAEVGTAISVSTLGGLFGTALAVRWLGIGNPALRLSLLSRNITSPLAMAIAGILGADVSLAVSMVVVTGLIGANFGASILDAFGIHDAVARGLSIGAAAHGLGTAAFVNEKDAFPFAAIGMALTASAATVAVSIPIVKRMLLQIALGW